MRSTETIGQYNRMCCKSVLTFVIQFNVTVLHLIRKPSSIVSYAGLQLFEYLRNSSRNDAKTIGSFSFDINVIGSVPRARRQWISSTVTDRFMRNQPHPIIESSALALEDLNEHDIAHLTESRDSLWGTLNGQGVHLRK